MKTFYIETYGCQMNEYDSLIAKNILEKSNTQCVTNPREADYILLNTCAIRENAHKKIYNKVKSLEYLTKNGTKIGILGCMAQNLKEDLLDESLEIDFILGPDSLRDLPKYMHFPTNEAKSSLNLSKTEVYDDVIPHVEHHKELSQNRIMAQIAIQRGCDNFCSFCVVPYTRGRERSRDPKDLIKEIQNLSQAGFQYVTLLGQNVNSYQFNNMKFSNLINDILNDTDIKRIYFTSPHPKDFPCELIDIMATNPRFCNRIHVPLQSGSDGILNKMKRGYTQKEFLKVIQLIREKVSDAYITTDIIVGFPTETEEDFLQTLETMQIANFDSAFMFAYSERKGTFAQKKYKDDLPWDIKHKRLEKVIERQLERSFKRNQSYIGKNVDIIIEGTSKRKKTDFIGTLTNGIKVIFQAPLNSDIQDYQGKQAKINIKSVTNTTLKGSYII